MWRSMTAICCRSAIPASTSERQEHRHPEVHVRQGVAPGSGRRARPGRMASRRSPVRWSMTWRQSEPGPEGDVVALERETRRAGPVVQGDRARGDRERPVHERRGNVDPAVVAHAGARRRAAARRPRRRGAGRPSAPGSRGWPRGGAGNRPASAGRSAASAACARAGGERGERTQGHLPGWSRPRQRRPPGPGATGRKVPRKRAERPSGPPRAPARLAGDAPCDPRVRAAPARLRPPPVRRGRPALGRRPGVLQAHRPLPRVRRGGPGRRRPALAAHGPGGVPRAGVPARLPGDAWSAPSETSSSRSCAAGCGSCWPPRPPARSRSWTPRSRSWTAGSAATTARTWASRRAALGVAIDVGTTTVVLELVDLETGAILAVAALREPAALRRQRRHDPHLVRRRGPGRAAPGAPPRAQPRAQAPVRASSGIDRRRLVDAYVVGNTTMRDLFFGLDVRPIGRIPYRSVTETAWREGRRPTTTVVRARPRARACWSTRRPGSRAGRSSPATSARTRPRTWWRWTPWPAAARSCSWTSAPTPRSSSPTGRGSSPRPARPARRSRAASSATGCPARTARSRTSGSWTAGSTISTIGDAEPEGICGSGLVDLLAELRRAGWMTDRGTLRGQGPRDPRGARPADHVLAGRRRPSRAGQGRQRRSASGSCSGAWASSPPTWTASTSPAASPTPSTRVRHRHRAARPGPGRPRRPGGQRVPRAGPVRCSLPARPPRWLDALVGRIEHVELETEPDFFDLFVDGCRFEPIAI